MAQINKPTDHFNTVLYTGNTNDNHSITGVGFEPDFTWIKSRTGTAFDHRNFDIVRGAGKRIGTNKTDAEATVTNELKSFDTDGFTLGTSVAVNGSANFASWNFKAGGTAVSNTDGTIISSVSANTTSGFSIVSYTGNGSTNQTTGHGLGVTPSLKIVKNRDSTTDWAVTGSALGTIGNVLALQDTRAIANQPAFFPADSSTTIGLSGSSSGSSQNSSGNDYIAYCFAEKKGFSKFGSYVGTGSSTETPFIYTGFKPAFVIIKNASSTQSWYMYDNARNPTNDMGKTLWSDLSDAEYDYSVNPSNLDMLSNGFKLRVAGAMNLSGQNITYMCFAENPLVGTNGIPATAR